MPSRLLLHSRGEEHGTGRLLAEVKEYLHAHAAEGLSNKQVAAVFGYHPYYLNGLFVAQEGCTLHR